MTEPYRAPPPEVALKVADKPLGDYYAVVLREPNFSLLRVGVAGGLGGRGGFPIPDFGEPCACCNGVARMTTPFDASTQRLAVDPIDVPVCPECLPHVKQNTNAEQLVGGSLIPIAVGLFIWALAGGGYLLTIPAVALGAGVAAYLAKNRRRRLDEARRGHHPHLEISVAIGQCVVRTTNRRLASRLVENHERELHRAR